MPVEAEVIYRTREQILADYITRFQTRISDLHIEEDGQVRILGEVLAELLEGVYLANQIARDNIFIQSANLVELRRHGEEVGLAIKSGVIATGSLRFSGEGGVFIPTGTEAGADSGQGDVLYYLTIADGTIPNPGDPGKPTVADAGAGTLPAGTYEYAITFETAAGETMPGIVSDPITIAVNHNITVSNIPLGGPGTIARNLYERVNGGAWKKNIGAADASLNNIVTTSVTVSAQATGGLPPEESTAEAVTVTAEAELPGEIYNAIVGTVTEVVDAPDGVTDVTNTVVFTGGTDEEDMESYRSRLLDFIRNPQTGSKEDIEGWAEGVDGVETATTFKNDNLGTPQNGHTTTRIAGPNGTIPSAAVIAAVLAEIDARDLANIINHVTTFTQVPTNVTVAITVAAGYLLADITASIQDAIKDYINSVPVGGTVYEAGIKDAVFGLPGVATLTTTFTDQTSTATQKRTPGTISVT